MDNIISRQAAMEVLKEKVFSNLTDEFYGVMQALNDLPSAEAIEVIRCGECIHWDESAGMGDHRWCRLLKVSMTATDYCSHGEGGKHE